MWKATLSKCEHCGEGFEIRRMADLDDFLAHETQCRAAVRAALEQRLGVPEAVARLFREAQEADGEEEEEEEREMDEVAERLWVGNHLSPQRADSEWPDEFAVCNCAAELRSGGRPLRAPLYLALELLDVPDFDLASVRARLEAFALRAQEESCRLLVHCALGRSRSVSVAALIMMVRDRRTLLDSMTAIRAARPSAYPNCGFWRQLIEFERTLIGNVSVPPEAVDALHVECIGRHTMQ